MVRLSKPDARDRVVNLMCGSGTILVERLLAGPTRTALGVDLSSTAIAAARRNAEAAGVADRLKLRTGNAADDGWPTDGPYDCVYADPPWGDKSGDHRSNERLHMMLLERSHAVSQGTARLVVLTHEIRIMERCVRRADGAWRLTSETRVFHKGHHPRIYVLQRSR
jgi:23S rRNA G2445 N2-methylase RlmL